VLFRRRRFFFKGTEFILFKLEVFVAVSVTDFATVRVSFVGATMSVVRVSERACRLAIGRTY